MPTLPDDEAANSLDSEVSCYDLSKDLAGKVKGLIEDLAVNPKYMDGFGE